MAVDGEGLSALRDLRKRSRTWLMTLPQPALADLGNPYIHIYASRTVVWQVMRINNGCTGTMDINVRQRAQRITPGYTNLGSVFYNAVFRSHGSIALFSGTRGILYSTNSISSYNSPVWTETRIPRNSRRRPPAEIFHQSLVWYCSRFYTPPLHTFCTHDRIGSEEHFGAITD